MPFMRRSKHKTLLIGLLGAAVLIGLVVYIVSRNSSQTDVAGGTWPASIEVEKIHTFMGDANLDLRYQETRSPSNFTVGETKELPGGGGSVTTVPEDWKRKVDVYDQVVTMKDCQFYTYELDARTGRVVQVQLANMAPVGTEAESEQGQCLKTLKPLTAAQAKVIALAYAKTDMWDLSKPGNGYTLKAEPRDGADRYDFTWENKDYKLADGLSSDPWPYPTVRVVINKNGYLMTYLNTAILYAPE